MLECCFFRSKQLATRLKARLPSFISNLDTQVFINYAEGHKIIVWQVEECQGALAEDFIGDRESSPSSPYRDELFEKGGASNPTPTSVLQLEEALSGDLSAHRERW